MSRRALLIALVVGSTAGRAHAQGDAPQQPAPQQPAPQQPAPLPPTPPGEPDNAAPLAPATPPPATPAEAPTSDAPPVAWKDWVIEGTLLETPEVLRAFVEPVMRRNRDWGSGTQLELRELLLAMGYETSFNSRPLPGGGTRAVINVTPVPLVRNVSINIDMRIKTRLLDPLFRDELSRQLRLRPGSPLSIEPRERAERLAEEERALALQMQNQGFYDARVSIKARETAPYGLTLDVDIAPGPAYRVGKVTVSGNTAVETQEIVKIFRDHPYYCLPLLKFCFGSKRFAKQQLDRDIENLIALYRKRGYPGVSVQTDFDVRHSFHRASRKVELQVDVRERRKVDVVFDGLSGKIREERLAEELTLDDEGSYDDVEIENSAQAVRRYLQRDGYFEANVAWERARFGLFERIIMTVDQGPKLRIKQVDFAGNRALRAEDLEGLIKTKRYKRLGLGQTGGYAISEQLEADADAIAARYRRAGYPDVIVQPLVARQSDLLDNAAAQAAAVAANLPSQGLWVRFAIYEGPFVTVEKAKLEFHDEAGNEVPPGIRRSALRDRIDVLPGTPYDAAGIENLAGQLRELYLDNGYPHAIVVARTEPGSRPDRRRVVFRVDPKVAVRIGKIAVRGNFRTRAWVIEDELRAKEGTLLTRRRIERMRANLQSSGLFSTSQVMTVGDKPGEPIVNLLVKVEERHDNYGELQAGAGGASDIGGYLTAQYKLGNAFGIGAGFQVVATGSLERFIDTPGLQRDEIETRLVLPRWIGRKIFGGGVVLETSLLIRRENTERLGVLDTYSVGQTATYAFPSKEFEGWQVSLHYEFRQVNREIDFFRPAGNTDDLAQTNVTNVSSTIGPALTIDKRKDRQGRRNPLAPSRGYMLRASGEYAEDVLFGKWFGGDRFIKLGVAGQHFFPIGARFQVSNSSSYDHGIPLEGADVLPDVERFFAGGDTTVRGFEQDRLETEIIEEPLAPGGGVTQFRVLPAGGNIRFLHRFDLQASVWAIGSVPWASAIFLDTGLVRNSLHGVQLRDLRHSVGLALARVVSPIGNFSLEWALPLDPKLGDNPLGRVHLTFGTNFGI